MPSEKFVIGEDGEKHPREIDLRLYHDLTDGPLSKVPGSAERLSKAFSAETTKMIQDHIAAKCTQCIDCIKDWEDTNVRIQRLLSDLPENYFSTGSSGGGLYC